MFSKFKYKSNMDQVYAKKIFLNKLFTKISELFKRRSTSHVSSNAQIKYETFLYDSIDYSYDNDKVKDLISKSFKDDLKLILDSAPSENSIFMNLTSIQITNTSKQEENIFSF